MKKFIVFLNLAFSVHLVWGQNDTLRTDVFEVIKPFKALLSESIKIPSNPNPEIPEVSEANLTYKLPELRHADVPTIYTIKPLSLGTSLLPKLKNNYTRIGYGNYNTPLLEVYLNSTRSRSGQVGAFYKHLSSNPDGNQTFSNNTAGVFGKKFVDNGVIEADVMYHRNVVHVFGYDKENLTLLQKADLKNQFGYYDFGVAYSNVLKDTSKTSFKIGTRFYKYSTNHGLDENDFKVNGKFRKSIAGNPLDVTAQVQLNNTQSKTTTYERVFIDVNPNYHMKLSKQLYLNMGFNATLFNDSNGGKMHFYPVVDAGFHIIDKALTLYSGITGNLQRNTLRSITLENPFVRQLQLYNTLKQFEAFVGFKGIISPQTSFVLQGSYATIQNMFFYGADSNFFVHNTIYETANSGLTQLRFELNHEFYKSFQLGFVMNYMGYDLTIAAPFSRPTFTTSTRLIYNMADKFVFRSEIFTMNERTALISDKMVEAKLGNMIDLNAGVEYRYTKHISVFVNFNNITNNQYQRWINTRVYGFNMIGGLGFTF